MVQVGVTLQYICPVFAENSSSDCVNVYACLFYVPDCYQNDDESICVGQAGEATGELARHAGFILLLLSTNQQPLHLPFTFTFWL